MPLPVGGTGAGVVRLAAPDRLIGAADDARGRGHRLTDAVREAVVAAERAGPARDAADLRPPAAPADPAFDAPAGETTARAFSGSRRRWPGPFGGRRAGRLRRAPTSTTPYLGSSTGVRLRHVQPDGAVSLVGRNGRRQRSSAWVGEPTVDSSTRR